MKNETSRPTEFQVAHRKYKIYYADDLQPGEPDVVGWSDHAANEVLISGRQTDIDTQETVMHEMLHCALVALGEHRLNANEKFVARLSALLAQALLSLK